MTTEVFKNMVTVVTSTCIPGFDENLHCDKYNIGEWLYSIWRNFNLITKSCQINFKKYNN